MAKVSSKLQGSIDILMVRWRQVFSESEFCVENSVLRNGRKKYYWVQKCISWMSSDPLSFPASIHPNLGLFSYSCEFFFPSCVLKPCLCNYSNSFIGKNSLSVFSYEGRKLMEWDFQLYLHVWICVKTNRITGVWFSKKIDKWNEKCYLWKKLKTITGVNYRKHVLTSICFFL